MIDAQTSGSERGVRLLLRPAEAVSEHASNLQRRTELPHILLVVDQFPEALGGGERIVLRLAGLLPRYGYQASILTFAVHAKSTLWSTPPPCPIYLLPITKTYDLAAARAALDLRRFIRAQRIRVVQTFFESSDIWAGTAAKLLSPAKVIWSRRDMGILRTGKHRVAYRLLSRLPDKVFAVSEQVRQHCLEVDHVEPSRVVTIYNGLDVEQWSADRKSVHGATILTVGNIRRVKGHDVLIRAAGLLARDYPDLRVEIAGEVLDAGYFAELQELVRSSNLEGSIHFMGGVSDLRDRMAGAAVFVLPSRSEGFSNAIVEAMAAGVPVVATDVGGNAEAVVNKKTGLIVPPEDPKALASAIAELLRRPKEAAEMGVAGRQRVMERFTTSAMMKEIVAVYRSLLRA